MTSKEVNLKKRLDALDEELQSLQARLAKRRTPGRRAQIYLPCSEESKHKDKISNEYKGANSTSKKHKNIEHKENILFQDYCKKFLQSISRSVAKGSEAIHKIASLTDISNFSEVPDHGDSLACSFSTNIKNGERIEVPGFLRENVYPKKKTKLLDKKSVKQSITKSQCEPFMIEIEKILKEYTQPSRSEMDNFSTVLTKGACNSEEAEQQEINMAEKTVILSLLRDKLVIVKKKLNDERIKRENAEKAIAGYRRRLAALEGKTTGKENRNIFKKPEGKENDAILFEEIEKELSSERNKRTEADKKINELQKVLEEKIIEIDKLEESKKLALTVAETFHDRKCQQDQEEMNKLRIENHDLEKQLIILQEKVQNDPDVIDNLLERAERAEKDLVDKMKQCHELMARCSVNDPEVQELLERHRSAYKELEIEKKYKETELKNQYINLKKELDVIKSNSEMKYKELNEKYNITAKELQGKELALQTLITGRSNFESEINDLKKRLIDAFELNEKQDATIKDLNEQLEISSTKLEKLSTEHEEYKKKILSTMDKKMSDYSGTIKEKENMISSLRKEVDNNKDTILIKEKMLKDQIDTIKCLRTVSDNTKKTLDDERAQKQKLQKEVNALNSSERILQSKLSANEKRLHEEELSFITLNKKSKESLKVAESEVSKRQRELEKQLFQMSFEKDQAIQTARFATEKLVQAINDYETKLSVQKRLYILLEDAYNEKDFEITAANQQLNELNEELWLSARNAEDMKNILQANLWKACEVCADVIDAQIEKDL